MGKTKQFVDKKSALQFRVVHRQHGDPTSTEEANGDHVLMPLNEYTSERQYDFLPTDMLAPKEEDREAPEQNEETLEKRLGEAAKYGIYFEDQLEYDYMQHLKETGTNAGAVFFPVEAVEVTDAAVTASHSDTSKASLKHKPTVDDDLLKLCALDEEISEVIQALQDSDTDNFLSDDFMAMANEKNTSDNEGNTSGLVRTVQPVGKQAATSIAKNQRIRYMDSQLYDLQNGSTDDEESSSDEYTNVGKDVTAENNRLQRLCESFVAKHSADDTKCSGEDRDSNVKSNSIHAGVNDKLGLDEIRQALQDREFYEFMRNRYLSHAIASDDDEHDKNTPEGEEVNTLSSSDEEQNCDTVHAKASAVRTNQPKIVNAVAVAKKIELSRKTGMPKLYLPRQQQRKLGVPGSSATDSDGAELCQNNKGDSVGCSDVNSSHSDEDSDSSYGESDENGVARNMGIRRPVDESKEEKHQRKCAVKEERRIRRMEKKALKMAFVEEKSDKISQCWVKPLIHQARKSLK